MRVNIPFHFHSEGLVEGDVQKGDFIIICDGGEYNLSFVASVTRFYAVSSVGKIKNLFGFTNLAQVSFDEAYRIFTAPFFVNILKEAEEREHLFYRAVGGEKATRQGLEEFLIGIRKKQRVQMSLETKKRQFSDVTENMKDSIGLEKERWGYLELSVTSDSPAVVPEKERITSDDFVGNHAELSYVIYAEKLHNGNNYARLYVRWPGRLETCDICIHVGEKEHSGRRREKKEICKRLMELYLDFRLQRLVTGVWSKETCRCLERLKELGAYDKWCMLYHAQALLINKQRQEAEWILDAFRRELPDKGEPLYAYYLYLCTLQEKEPSYVAKAFRQVQEIYQRNQEDLRLFMIMLFLDPELNQSRSRKLSAIVEKISEGIHSPLLYMEAYYLVRQDVYLLFRAGEFERQLLYWAAKEHALTRDLAAQTERLMMQVRQYHPLWYTILEECYVVRPEVEMLKAICTFCIKWNLKNPKYAVWYERGIREDLKLAGLYEAWLECAEGRPLEEFPKSVMIYFQYQSSLADKKKAQLYAGIVRNKENQKALYGTYQKQIQNFSYEQLRKGQIDDNLALLYESEWRELVVDEEVARALAGVLYTHRLSCFDDQAKRVIVVHRELKREQKVPLIRNQAYVQLYTGSYCILAEDERGVRYVPEEFMEIKSLMRPGHYVRSCIRAAGQELPHLLHYFEGRKIYQTFQEEDMPRLRFLLEAEEISQVYKDELKPQIIEYYYHSYTGDELDEYLNQVDYVGLERGIRNRLMELMISRGIYDRAYEMLTCYGSEQATVSKLMLVASQRIQEMDYEADARLIRLCSDIFQHGKYNEQILRYLCRYYQGGIRQLEELMMAAWEFEVEVFSLEERFLTQLLFTEGYTDHMEQAFSDYFHAKGREMLIMAYLSYFSYQYFVRQVVISDAFFECLEQQLLLGNPLNDSCRLACFKWLTERQRRTEKQERLLEELLSEYLGRRKFFSFYHQLPQNLLRKYQLYDRVILEYRTDPKHRVLIDYCCGGVGEKTEYMEEDMEQMYEGIFAKVFVVFFGEEIPYYIKEESPNRQMITESGHIKPHDLMTYGDESSYDLINGMMVSYHMKDKKTLRQLHDQYQRKRQQVEELFHLL